MRCDWKNATPGSSKNWPPLGEELSNSCARTRSLERLSGWTDKKAVRVESPRIRFHRSERVRYSTSESPTARRGASGRERKWRKKSEGGWTGRRSPLTSRQSGAAEVSMTPVRGRSADAARRLTGAARRRAPSLKRGNHYYGPSFAVPSENTTFNSCFSYLKDASGTWKVNDQEVNSSVKHFYTIFFGDTRRQECTREIISCDNVKELLSGGFRERMFRISFAKSR